MHSWFVYKSASLYNINSFIDFHEMFKHITRKEYNKQYVFRHWLLFSFCLLISMSKIFCEGRKWNGLTDNVYIGGDFAVHDKVCSPGTFSSKIVTRRRLQSLCLPWKMASKSEVRDRKRKKRKTTRKEIHYKRILWLAILIYNFFFSILKWYLKWTNQLYSEIMGDLVFEIKYFVSKVVDLNSEIYIYIIKS